LGYPVHSLQDGLSDSETHQSPLPQTMGFAALNPSYKLQTQKKLLGIARRRKRSMPPRFGNSRHISRSRYHTTSVHGAFDTAPRSPTFAMSRPPRVLSRGIA
jgi:hypothetical protein